MSKPKTNSRSKSEHKVNLNELSGELSAEMEIDFDNLQPHEIVRLVSQSLNADIFLYSGDLVREGSDAFVELANTNRKNEIALLILSTPGGDADSAYIIARFLKRTYKKFILCVYGYCKSAGTLLALGADEIIMSSRGEFGPLDVQIPKADEIGLQSSGLDISQALKSLSEQAFKIWEEQFIEIKERSAGIVTTRTAGEIASSLAVGLLSPVTAQIDPFKMGEMHRAVNIAYHYGIRLSGDSTKVDRLILGYPSHSFVIDYEEAREIFGNVREPNLLETVMELFLIQTLMEETGYDCVRSPSPKGIVAYLNPDEKEIESESRASAANEDDTQHGEEIGYHKTNGRNRKSDRTRSDDVSENSEEKVK